MGLGYRERPGSAGSGSSSGGGSSSLGVSKGPVPEASKSLSGAGPATDRYSAMRQAFRSQYNSQFRASSDRTWEQTVPETGVFTAPPPPPPPPGGGPGTTQGSGGNNNHNSLDAKRAKKSRWN